MRSKRLSIGLTAILASTLVTLLTASTHAAAQQETILHSFPSSSKDGTNPESELIFDSAGNLYGTAPDGGSGVCTLGMGCGVAFELVPAAGGGWTEKILHTFGNGTDGATPFAGLIFDLHGNLYGATENGGSGQGTVFELSPGAHGVWIEKILHNFAFNSTDGRGPTSLTIDAAGNLYGITSAGGLHYQGTVFELSHSAGGGWTEKILHNFGSNSMDGTEPNPGLIFDADGNLYGTTFTGGAYGLGTAFELKRSASGVWTEKNLHNFNNNGTDGYFPAARLVLDAAGNLYGTTATGGLGLCGGSQSCGTVYKLTPMPSGTWNETVIYNFNQDGGDGYASYAGLIFDAAGNLYGTTSVGGTPFNQGAVFELTPTAGGAWSEILVYSFGVTSDGTNPLSGLTFDKSGNLYGTTYHGGADASGQSGGTVFELKP
jgi:uncharacterized repeat protein (TIGR03803 family)